MCPSGIHITTPITIWCWAAYTATKRGNTSDTSWDSKSCHSIHRPNACRRTTSPRTYGGPCQSHTQGRGGRTARFRRTCGDSSTRESPRDRRQKISRGFGREHARYLSGRKKLPLCPPAGPTREEVIFATLMRAVPKPHARERRKNG